MTHLLTFLFFTTLNFGVGLNAQPRQFHVNEALTFLNMQKKDIFENLNDNGYVYTGRDGLQLEFYIFKNTTNIGTFQVTLCFNKSGRVNLFSWQEHWIYFIQNILQREVEQEGFQCDESTKNSYGGCIKKIYDTALACYKKPGYMITMMCKEDGSNIVNINLGINTTSSHKRK